MRVYTIFVVLTSEIDLNKNYILSLSDTSSILPICLIENTKFLHNEIRYHLKSFFNQHIKSLIESIELSYLDIQNEFAQKYIDSINTNDFYKDDDLFLLSGLILDQKYDSKYYWNQFSFRKTSTIIDSLIDLTIQKTIL